MRRVTVPGPAAGPGSCGQAREVEIEVPQLTARAELPDQGLDDILPGALIGDVVDQLLGLRQLAGGGGGFSLSLSLLLQDIDIEPL